MAEALWKGTPVIGGNVGGIRLQIEDSVSGYLVDTVEECVDRVLTLLRNPSLAHDFAIAGKEKVRQNFLVTQNALAYLRLLHKLNYLPIGSAQPGTGLVFKAAIFGNRIISVATVVGYMGGFILAMIFNTDGVDPGGGRTNNAWVIWGAVLICAILIGIIFAFIFKQRRKTVRG